MERVKVNVIDSFRLIQGLGVIDSNMGKKTFSSEKMTLWCDFDRSAMHKNSSETMANEDEVVEASLDKLRGGGLVGPQHGDRNSLDTIFPSFIINILPS